MNHRQLHRPQQAPQELDVYALQAFQDDVIREFKETRELVTRINTTISLQQDRIYQLEDIIKWVHTNRPEAIKDYQTTMSVAMRLSDSNEGGVMTEKMV